MDSIGKIKNEWKNQETSLKSKIKHLELKMTKMEDLYKKQEGPNKVKDSNIHIQEMKSFSI